jgi:hypothetical protein
MLDMPARNVVVAQRFPRITPARAPRKLPNYVPQTYRKG